MLAGVHTWGMASTPGMSCLSLRGGSTAKGADLAPVEYRGPALRCLGVPLVGSLLVQGSTLPWLVRRVGLPAPDPAELLGRWNLDPVALLVVLFIGLWAWRSRPGIAAAAVLALAFVSPLCALSSALFSAQARADGPDAERGAG